MKSAIFAMGLAMIAMAIVSQLPADSPEGAKPGSIERIVTPREGVTKFVVTGRSTLFRLPISVIAGGAIHAPRIIGSAVCVRVAEVVEVNEQGTPSVGAINKEFVFRGTAAGTVTVEITKTLPTQPAPVIERYTVTIK